MKLDYARIAKLIDHSLLKPTLTETALLEGCRLAVRYEVASVCIMPFALARCVELLAGSTVQPSTTVGFPHGAQSRTNKVSETSESVKLGAMELDMVVNISHVLSGNLALVRDEIRAVLDVVRAGGARLKVIFENCYLNRDQKLALCDICGDLGVDWVKTSTGFGTSGATVDDVRLMVENTPPEVAVKAAGGIQSLEMVLKFAELGATRVGSSATAAILDDLRRRLELGDAAG